MKQGQLTFADRARAIMAKYSKFKDDPISIKSMDRELELLAQEQEELKAAQEQQAQMQQGQMQQEGQPQQMWDGGIFDGEEVQGIIPNNNMDWKANNPFGMRGINPLPGTVNRNISQPGLQVPPTIPSSGGMGSMTQGMIDYKGQMPPSRGMVAPEKDLAPFPTNYGIVPDPSAFMRQNSLPKDNSSPYGPYANGYGAATPKAGPTSPSVPSVTPEDAKFNMMGAAGAAGNVFQLIDDIRNPADVENYGRVDPSLIDSTIQESNARNAINTSINNVVGASDETSQTGGQRLSRRAGLESARRDKVGRALGQIREQTDNTNAQIKNRTAEFNKGIDIREANDNSQNAAARKARIASNLNQIGANVLAKPKSEQNANQVVNNQNARLINMINSGYFSDYTMDEMLKIVARKTTKPATKTKSATETKPKDNG